jgi:hypothetical protein
MTSTVRLSCPGISGAQPYPLLVDPLSYIPTQPRPPSVEQRDHDPYVDHRESHVLYSTLDFSPSHHQHHHDASGMACMHRGTSPQQHLQCPLRLLLQGTPRFCCKPYSPLESIKGEGKKLSREDDRRKNEIDIFPTSEINISSNTPLYSFFETWDRSPLSRLVTPTQAVRCKEIQYSPYPLDIGPSFARTRINPRVFSLHHHLG